MKPSEIRDELIAQHRGLRSRIDEARLATLRWARGEASPSQVRDALAELADALRAHHLHEESSEFVDDEHAREHRELVGTLSQVGSATAPADAGRELENFCSKVLAHMTWEERAFLNRSVLREDADGD